MIESFSNTNGTHGSYYVMDYGSISSIINSFTFDSQVEVKKYVARFFLLQFLLLGKLRNLSQ